MAVWCPCLIFKFQLSIVNYVFLTSNIFYNVKGFLSFLHVCSMSCLVLSLEAFVFSNSFPASTRFYRSKSRNARTSGLLAFYWICETANRKVVISERAHLSVTCVRVGPVTVLPTWWQFYNKSKLFSVIKL